MECHLQVTFQAAGRVTDLFDISILYKCALYLLVRVLRGIFLIWLFLFKLSNSFGNFMSSKILKNYETDLQFDLEWWS